MRSFPNTAKALLDAANGLDDKSEVVGALSDLTEVRKLDPLVAFAFVAALYDYTNQMRRDARDVPETLPQTFELRKIAAMIFVSADTMLSTDSLRCRSVERSGPRLALFANGLRETVDNELKSMDSEARWSVISAGIAREAALANRPPNAAACVYNESSKYQAGFLDDAAWRTKRETFVAASYKYYSAP